MPSADEVKTNERERTEMIIKALSRVPIKYEFVMPRGKPVVDDFKNSITVGVKCLDTPHSEVATSAAQALFLSTAQIT